MIKPYLVSSRHAAGLLCLLAACTGTPSPKENYAPRPGAEPAAADGAAGDGSTGTTTELVLEPLFDGCGAPPASTQSFNRQRLRQAALACTAHQLCGFEAAASALAEAVAAHADAPSDATRKAAREAYRQAMGVWSRLEVMQYGPLGAMATSASEDMYQGEGLREQVYAWPLVARCRVDEQVVEQDYVDEGVRDQLVSAKGLFALEYLLFAPEDGGSACAASSDTAAALEALDGDARAARRRAYARAVARDLADLADTLVGAYAPDGAFAGAFVDASGYPSGQEALNVLAWSLIYIERELKDWKLGIPAGLTMNAPVSEAEAPLSGISGRLLEQNLLGFTQIFQGCGADGTGLGFDDWLDEAGQGSLRRDILAARDGAAAALAALPDDLSAATDAQLTRAYESVRDLALLLKSDFFGPGSPLGLALPASVEGDTD